VTGKSAGRAHRHRGEWIGGTASGRHMAIRRAYRRRSERTAYCDRKVGGANTPLVWRAAGEWLPEIRRSKSTASGGTVWCAETEKSAWRAHRRRGERLASGYRKVDGAGLPPGGDRMARRDRKVDRASTPPARRADGWRGEWMACSDRKVRGASTPPARYADSTRAEGVRYGEQMDDSRLDYVGSLVRERLD
jgi:hypothetical protein